MLALSARLCATALYHTRKALPDFLDDTGDTVLLDDRVLEFIYDLTCGTGNARTVEQHIFDRMFALIDKAQRYVLIDMFLFNSYGAKGGEACTAICLDN